MIDDETKLVKLFSEMSAGGLDSYDVDNQALVLCLESGGGPYEDITFYLHFNYTEYFQLPLSLTCVTGWGIDEIRHISFEEVKTFIPEYICEHFDKDGPYKCYRFYANNNTTPYYVYCLNLTGRIDPENWEQPKGYELW